MRKAATGDANIVFNHCTVLVPKFLKEKVFEANKQRCFRFCLFGFEQIVWDAYIGFELFDVCLFL